MTEDPPSATFAALSGPTRREILVRLAAGEATVTELDAFLKIGMAEGWAQSLERLEALVATA
jgi:DNA-binding transcriptional ArsR family regulator